MDTASQEGHQQSNGQGSSQKTFCGICLVLLALIAVLATGCVSGPSRDLGRDQAAEDAFKVNQPDVRSPIDPLKAPEDEPAMSLEGRVLLLTSEDPLQRMQGANALRADLEAGVNEILSSLPVASVEVLLRIAILEWLKTSEVPDLSSELQVRLRACLADLLNDDSAEIRRHVAEIFQRFGPEEKRTEFLKAIADEDRRVRWSVVHYFGGNQNELNRIQRLILVGYLNAGKRDEFYQLDTNNDYTISDREWKQDAASFKQFDRNDDGDITFDEWINPYPASIRADVYALLLRLHEAHSPTEKPYGYNPYADATDQLKAVQIWRTWGQSVEDLPND